MERLFVYGTLAPGRVNHYVVEDIPGDWETATVKGQLLEEGWGSQMGYPGIILSEEGEDVEGFVLSSNQLSKYWPMLDEFEGDGYTRVPVNVQTKSGVKIGAYVYEINHATKPM